MISLIYTPLNKYDGVISISSNIKISGIKFGDVMSISTNISIPTPNFNISIPTPNFYIFNFFYDIFNTSITEKISPLVPNFHYDRMISSFYYVLNNKLFTSGTSFIQFEHFFQHYNSCNLAYSFCNIILRNFWFQLFLLTVVSYLMQTVSKIVCAGLEPSFIVSKSMDYTENTNKRFYKSFSWFDNTYNYIVYFTSWVYKYLYHLGYKKLYIGILLKVYKNIKWSIVTYTFTNKLDLAKGLHISSVIHVFHVYTIIFFASKNVNIIYAALTLVYIGLGWLLDYLSFMWIVYNNTINYGSVSSITFWTKKFIYGILYLLWLYMGVISTNGIYFCIHNNSDIIMLVLGSIMSYIFSNLWFYFAQANTPESISSTRLFDYLGRFIFSFLSPGVFDARYWYRDIARRVLYWAFLPISFNAYSSFRRSIFEWLSFLGMVFSTYGSWNIYFLNIFNNIRPIYHFLIWCIPTFLSGYGLIYVEEARPRFAHLFYGFIYLTFWTSICFATNSVLAGYFDVNNASAALYYFIPINTFVAFVYSLPLYRASLVTELHPSIIRRLFHLLFFILLTGITLITAGLIWYNIG